MVTSPYGYDDKVVFGYGFTGEWPGSLMTDDSSGFKCE